jgi:nucleotide-binding universal stress UspA family protein
LQFSPALREVLSGSSIPVMLVRAGRDLQPPLSFRRILTTAAGSDVSRAAEQVAYALASRAAAEVDVVHVVSRGDKVLAAMWFGETDAHSAARSMLARSLDLARQFGMSASGLTRVGTATNEELLTVAEDRNADTIVVGTRIRALDDRPFLGHGVEYLLEHAPQTLVVIGFPAVESVGWWSTNPVSSVLAGTRA